MKKAIILLSFLTTLSTPNQFIYDVDKKFFTITDPPSSFTTNCNKFSASPRITFQLRNFLISQNLNPDLNLPFVANVSVSLEDFNFGNTTTELFWNSGSEKIADNKDGFWNMVATFRPAILDFEILGDSNIIYLKGGDPKIVLRTSLMNGDLVILSYRFGVKTFIFENPVYLFEPANSLSVGCLALRFSSECVSMEKENFIVLKSEDYGGGVDMFWNKVCEVYVNGEENGRTDICEFRDGNEIVFKGIFEEGNDYTTLSLKICGIVTPPNFLNSINSGNYFEFYIKSKNDFVLFNNEAFELKSKDPILTEKVDITFNKKIVNSDFELILKPEFDCVKFSVKGFQIKIELPKEYITLIPRLSIEFLNNDTLKTQYFNNINSTERFFLIDIKNEIIHPKKSFSLKIFGFKIPDIVGDLNLTVSLYDALTFFESKDYSDEILITQPFNINFSIFPHLDESLKITLSNYNLGNPTNCLIQANIHHKNFSKEKVDLKIYFKNALKIRELNFKGIQNTLNFDFLNFEIDEENNLLKINQLKLNNYDVKTYMKFDLIGLETKKIDYKQLEMKIEAYDENTEIYIASYYINLIELNIDLKKGDLVIQEKDERSSKKKFVFSAYFSLDGNVGFDHFLRVNMSKGFVVESGVACIRESNLPNYKEDLKCELGKFRKYDESHFRQNIVFKDILKYAVSGVIYKLEFEGYLEEYMERQNKFFFDILPYFENEEDFSNYQIQDSQKISELKTLEIFLNCPLSCKKCEISLKTPLICYECDKTQNLEIDILTNTCKKIKTINTSSTPLIETSINISKISLTEKISKIFIGIFFSFYPSALIIMLYLKLLYKNIFKQFIFLASLFTFIHYILTYILLVYTVNTLPDSTLNTSILMIIIFFLTNAIFSLGTFAKGNNKVMQNVKIFNVKSNHMFFTFVYCVFGSGVALWVSIFEFSNVYSKLLIDDLEVKKFKKLYKVILYFNLIFVMGVTLGISVVFLGFVEIESKLVYYYMGSGFFCSLMYFLLVFKENKNFKFSKMGFSNEKEKIKILDGFGKDFENLEEVTDCEFFENLADGDIKELFSKLQDFGKTI